MGDIDVGARIDKVPNFAAGFTTFQLTPNKVSALPCEIYVHMNLGTENIGKVAYIFKLNTNANAYELTSASIINEIGNIAVPTEEMTNIVVLVQD
jgi:hypothetical protein